MKRLIFLLSAIVLFAGCAKIEEIDQPSGDQTQTEVETTGSELPEVIYANVADEEDAEDPQTRAYVGNDGQTVLWHNGDAVSYFGEKANAKYVYNGEDGAAQATMDLDWTLAGTENYIESDYTYAVYPYDANMVISTEGNLFLFDVNYPTTQTYVEGSFGKGANVMVAAKENAREGGFTFLHAGGYLVLKLYGEGVSVSSITLSTLDSNVKLAGDACLVVENNSVYEVAMIEGATSEVTLDCSNGGAGVALGATAETATEFWFALPVVNIEGGFKIRAISTNNDILEMQTTKTVNIERAKVQPMAAIEFDPNIAPPNMLFYTTTDGKIIDFAELELDPFNAEIASHTYENGRGVIKFKTPLTEIKDGGFVGFNYTYDRCKLRTITLPETVTRFGANAFFYTFLTEITIPGSVVEIGEGAFKECNDLTSIKFYPSPTNTPLKIANYTNDVSDIYGPFADSPLTSINLNRQLEYVDDDGNPFTATSDRGGIFYYELLTYDDREEVTVTIGEQVTSILANMFVNAPIKNLTIPANVTKIDARAFYLCTKLANITFESSTNDLVIVESNGNNGDAPFLSSPLTSINLDRELVYQDKEGNPYVADSWKHGIFANFYYNDVSGVSITLGPNVKTIHDHMFAYLRISTLNIGNGVKTIGEGAFRDTPITSLTIPASVTTIGVDAFYNCAKLERVNFLGSETSSELPLYIGYSTYLLDEIGPFYYSRLKSVTVDRNLSYHMGMDSDGNPITFAPDQDDEGMFSTDDNTVTFVTIGNHVRILGEYTFSYLPITSFTIPGNVRTIKNNVFNGCPNITSVTFEAGQYPLTLGYNTDYEGEDDAGNDVVGKGLFLDSPNINTVVLNRNISYYFDETIYYSDYSSLIRASIFNNNHTLTNVTIGEEVTSLPNYAFAGAGLSGKDIRLHEGLQTIGEYAFYDAQINGGIYIPASVTRINDGVFRLNNNSQITCLGTTPPTIVGYPFYTNILYRISVPAESVDAYKAAWQTPYEYQIQAIE